MKRYFYFCHYNTKKGTPDCDVVRVLKLGYRHICRAGKGFTPTTALDSKKMMNKVFIYFGVR